MFTPASISSESLFPARGRWGGRSGRRSRARQRELGAEGCSARAGSSQGFLRASSPAERTADLSEGQEPSPAVPSAPALPSSPSSLGRDPGLGPAVACGSRRLAGAARGECACCALQRVNAPSTKPSECSEGTQDTKPTEDHLHHYPRNLPNPSDCVEATSGASGEHRAQLRPAQRCRCGHTCPPTMSLPAPARLPSCPARLPEDKDGHFWHLSPFRGWPHRWRGCLQ